nr:Dihydrofolate reductase [uncultured bacterium]
MTIVLIAGVAQNNVIGQQGALPWYISEDLKRFKELTTGHPVVMGRKTYESIVQRLGKPLPHRKNIVVTSNTSYQAHPEVLLCSSVQEALMKAQQSSEKVFVIGGQQIYEQTLPLAHELEITHVHKAFEGDAYFPEIKKEEWKEVKREERTGDMHYSFVSYQRSKKGLFIVFEGIDGCGKTTQLKRLVEYLFAKSKYNHLVVTREPYQETKIRNLLHAETDPHSQAEQIAQLFIADRKNHAEHLITPSIQKGMHIISDRYKLSTIAYQHAQGLPLQRLIDMHYGLPIPDITFVIDLPAKVAAQRMSKESSRKAHKFEANLEFLEQVRMNFHKAKEALPQEKIFILDGQRAPEVIAAEIKESIDASS